MNTFGVPQSYRQCIPTFFRIFFCKTHDGRGLSVHCALYHIYIDRHPSKPEQIAINNIKYTINYYSFWIHWAEWHKSVGQWATYELLNAAKKCLKTVTFPLLIWILLKITCPSSIYAIYFKCESDQCLQFESDFWCFHFLLCV